VRAPQWLPDALGAGKQLVSFSFDQMCHWAFAIFLWRFHVDSVPLGKHAQMRRLRCWKHVVPVPFVCRKAQAITQQMANVSGTDRTLVFLAKAFNERIGDLRDSEVRLAVLPDEGEHNIE